ncbi:hypothetical protein [Sinorhizobium psoraleae]|uniref:hypothetical protein n=1 Tax=Sinorhizobium psoraleae TaxID=520838 RepID=UPI0022AEB001|nr:hypothetical protein [Sinorhizobium psoraleae]
MNINRPIWPQFRKSWPQPKVKTLGQQSALRWTTLPAPIGLLARVRLRAQDARLQLIKAGISGTRISTVSEPQEDIGNGVRLRFFGSR